MKLKYVIFYGAVAVAFAAVSLWVILSKGKSAKAVRSKFRLGGIMLSLSGLMAAGCGQTTCYDVAQPTCYDVAAENIVSVRADGDNAIVKPGDVITVTVYGLTYNKATYRIETDETTPRLLSEGDLVFSQEDYTAKITVPETDYKGNITVNVYGVKDDGSAVLIGSDGFQIQ